MYCRIPWSQSRTVKNSKQLSECTWQQTTNNVQHTQQIPDRLVPIGTLASTNEEEEEENIASDLMPWRCIHVTSYT